MSDEERYDAALDRIFQLVLLFDGEASTGLTPARAMLLWTLRRTGPAPPTALAEALGVSPRRVAGLVDHLAAAGYLTTGPPLVALTTGPPLVALTPRGQAAVASLDEQKREFGRDMFAAMPGDSLDTLTANLDEVLATVRRMSRRRRPGEPPEDRPVG